MVVLCYGCQCVYGILLFRKPEQLLAILVRLLYRLLRRALRAGAVAAPGS